MAHQLNDMSFLKYYKYLKKHEWCSVEELERDQLTKLRSIVNFAYQNVPYYRKKFRSINLLPEDIKSIKDMEKIPVLTKDIVRENFEDLKPINLEKINYLNRSTGGSTGVPFQYRMDRDERFFMAAMMYRGWGYGGYELADRTIFFGGSSLGISLKSNLIKRLNEGTRNIRMISSFDMDELNLQYYVKTINKFKPKFLYGYASSLNFLSSYIKKHDLVIHHPLSIFSTAEKLYFPMRKNIEDVFHAAVFDAYGLNDGGVSAYECDSHNGLHIDTERGLMEIVDEDLYQIDEGYGSILATSLQNQSMPFIRYDTGDLGAICADECSCGRKYRLLKEVIGRTQDILKTPEGKYVHGEFFTHIFWEISGVIEFQVRQVTEKTIKIELVLGNNFDPNQLDVIQRYVHSKSSEWDVQFIISDRIKKTNAGKYRFVVNEVKDENW